MQGVKESSRPKEGERVKPEEREEEEEGRTMFFEKLQWKLLRRVAAGDLNKRTSGHQSGTGSCSQAGLRESKQE